MKIDAVAYATAHINKLAVCSKHTARARELGISYLIESSISKYALCELEALRPKRDNRPREQHHLFTSAIPEPLPHSQAIADVAYNDCEQLHTEILIVS